MAAQQTCRGESQTSENSMTLEGFDCIAGAGGRVTAGAGGAEEKVKDRREEQTIKSDDPDECECESRQRTAALQKRAQLGQHLLNAKRLECGSPLPLFHEAMRTYQN